MDRALASPMLIMFLFVLFVSALSVDLLLPITTTLRQQEIAANCSLDPTLQPYSVITDREWRRVNRFVASHGLSFLDEDALNIHKFLIEYVEINNIPGYFLEFGVAKGGSALTFAGLKRPNRCLHLFDTFEGK